MKVYGVREQRGGVGIGSKEEGGSRVEGGVGRERGRKEGRTG